MTYHNTKSSHNTFLILIITSYSDNNCHYADFNINSAHILSIKVIIFVS